MIRSIVITFVVALAAVTGCVNADDSHTKGGDKDVNADQTAGGGATHSVNGSIRVAAGQKKDDISTVNGSIHIADNAVVAGAQTVNGSISMGAHATADEVHTVNGSITLGEGASVSHAISAVNGTLTLHTGADAGGALTNVNGRIVLQAAHVGGGIKTVNGNMDIGSNSHVDGGILVQREGTNFFWFFHWGSSDTPRIVIGPGAVVQGSLRFERPVHLFVSDSATIGPVTGAAVVKFSGESPPG
ncbi:MAG TPA: hypothetical protein VK820_04475 [Steroidobacteraceae bacterium]|nr:hypothetical protein [Steroidobacteraceae bacterium]